VPYRRQATNTVFQSDQRVKRIHVNNFYPDLTIDRSAAGMEAAQRQGQVPFPNVQNLVYASEGKTVITCYPNFYLTDTEAALSQTDNSERSAPDGGGVSLFRTVARYGSNTLLETPELITKDTWAQFGPSSYDGYQSIEPATGATIAGQLANMMSVFSWNCNPALNMSLCDVLMYENDGSMCYATSEGADSPYMFACSAANVFTPRVQGGKVNPVWWLLSQPRAEEAYDILTYAMDVRYSLSILLVLVPVLGVLGVAAVVWYASYYKKKELE
jgi:hypothetical protein